MFPFVAPHRGCSGQCVTSYRPRLGMWRRYYNAKRVSKRIFRQQLLFPPEAPSVTRSYVKRSYCLKKFLWCRCQFRTGATFRRGSIWRCVAWQNGTITSATKNSKSRSTYPAVCFFTFPREFELAAGLPGLARPSVPVSYNLSNARYISFLTAGLSWRADLTKCALVIFFLFRCGIVNSHCSLWSLEHCGRETHFLLRVSKRLKYKRGHGALMRDVIQALQRAIHQHIRNGAPELFPRGRSLSV